MDREKIAKELLRLARQLDADMEEVTEEAEDFDPRFVEKVRMLKRSLPRLTSMRRKKLNSLGIGTIRGNNTIEDLVDAMIGAVGMI